MPNDVCIVHIEDEYYQMQNLASRMKQYAEQYWSARPGATGLAYARLVKSAHGGEADNTWVVYDVVGSPVPDERLSYIFVSGPELPQQVLQHIRRGAYFIIDVLRSKPECLGLASTAEASIASVQDKVGASLENITIYTACQGTDRSKLLKAYPGIRIISKNEPGTLSLLISKIVVAGLNGARIDE